MAKNEFGKWFIRYNWEPYFSTKLSISKVAWIAALKWALKKYENKESERNPVYDIRDELIKLEGE